MVVAPWLVSELCRERNWSAVLARIAGELRAATPDPRKAHELAAATEYIEPDRRQAIAIHELAGETQRARELAIEVGWWAAAARLAARAGDRAAEACAWWDAGQVELCALALAGMRDDEPLARDLAALVTGKDCPAAGGDADASVMAARFAQARGRTDAVREHLEAALALRADHAVAARWLLTLAIASRDPDQIRGYLRLRLAGQARDAWLDAVRACAVALIGTEHHRGFGLRLVRHTLERAYQLGHGEIPGHLAMWSLAAHHAAADGTRRELLPLAITAIESSREPVDRVWIAALAAEISLRDGGSAEVAGAYAAIVADHAPGHPIARELRAEPRIDIDIDLPEAPADMLAEIVESANAVALAPPPPKVVPPQIKTIPIAKIAPSITPTTRGMPPLSRLPMPPKRPDPPDAKERARRIAIPIDVRVVLADGRRCDGHSRDLSTTGLFVLTEALLVPGGEVSLELLVPGKEAFTEDEYRCRARVVRRGAGGYGLELIAPDAALQAALAAL